MKKLLAILLMTAMLLSLIACGDKKDSDEDSDRGNSNSSDVNPENIDFSAIMSGNGGTDIVWGKQDEATKQAIIEEGRQDGVDVSFGADGSMTVVDTDGTTVVQNPDGTWIVRNADGSEGQLGGNWPDNEYTRLVPEPDFELYAASTDEEGFYVSFSNVTLDQIKAYVARVKAAGFNINEEVEEQAIGGMVIYSFTAENSEGYTVEISSAAGTTGMAISK